MPGDVGTEISLPTETVRGSAFEVAATNLSRVQESLRSAEEFAKTQDQELASCLERLRYRAYGLDKSFLRLTEGRRRLSGAQLYLLLAINGLPLPYRVIAESALAGGVDVIQLRDKTLDDAALLEAARVLRQITRDVRKLLIINDRPDIACLVDADGVHLGQDDLPVSEARRIVGPDRLIGVSTHSLEDVFGARHDGADYIGVGPTFPSQTKQFERFAGTPFVESVCRDHAIPAFAIGGIDDANIDQVTNAGCSRIAVSRAITHSEQPEVAARRLKAHLVEASGDSVGPKTVSGKTLHA